MSDVRVLVDLEATTEHGAPVTVHLTDGEMPPTGAADDPPREPYLVRLASALFQERNGFDLEEGWPRLLGSSPPTTGEVVANNGDGEFDVWPNLRWDGGSARIRTLERGRPTVEATTWYQGSSRGRARARLGQASVVLTDFADRLRVPAQNEKLLGLGGCLTLPGTGACVVRLASPLKLSGSVPPDPLDSLPAGTWVFLARWDAVDDGTFLKKGDPSPFAFTIATSGVISAALQSSGGATVTLSSPPILVASWYWVALRWDGATARLYLCQIDGKPVGSNAQVAMATFSAASLSSSSSSPLELGWRLLTSMAHARIYGADIGEARLLASLGRPLDPADPADTQNLLVHLPLDDRFGARTRELQSGRDAQITGSGYVWGSTESGRREQRGLYRPFVLGQASAVALVQLDRIPAGDVFAGRFTYIAHNGVALAGPYDQSYLAVERIAATKTIAVPSGLVPGIVPGATIKVTWTVGGAATYTVADVGEKTVWVNEVLTDYQDGGTVRVEVVAPQWTNYGSSSTLVASPPANGQLAGWKIPVASELTDFADVLYSLLVDHGPRLAPGEVDIAVSRNWPVGLALGTGQEDALGVAQLLCRSVGADLGSDGTRVVVRDIPIAGDPLATIEADEILSIEETDLGPPPTEIVVTHSEAQVVLAAGSTPGAAWSRLVDTCSKASVEEKVPVVGAADWPSGRPSQPIRTLLVRAQDARAIAQMYERVARARVFVVRVGGGGAAGLRLFARVRVLSPRLGFAAGRDCTVGSVRLEPSLRRAQISLLEVPE